MVEDSRILENPIAEERLCMYKKNIFKPTTIGVSYVFISTIWTRILAK